jgi:hypothetical protein
MIFPKRQAAASIPGTGEFAYNTGEQLKVADSPSVTIAALQPFQLPVCHDTGTIRKRKGVGVLPSY